MNELWEDAELDAVPGLRGSLEGLMDETSAPFESLEEFVLCSAWWDALHLMDEHGINSTTPHEDQVVCRVCGEAVDEVTIEHLAGHEMGEDEYRRRHPVAPTTPRERAALPAVDFEW